MTGSLHPPGRMRERRRLDGMDILTLRQAQVIEAGIKHSVGLYVHAPGSANEGHAS